MDEAKFENEVKNIITIFNCIQNKDLFLLKYSQKFTKRILSMKESCLSYHELFISNLKMKYLSNYLAVEVSTQKALRPLSLSLE